MKCVLSSSFFSQCSSPLKSPSANCHNGANIPKKTKCDLHWKEAEWTVGSLNMNTILPNLSLHDPTSSLSNLQAKSTQDRRALRPRRWRIYQIIIDLVCSLLRFQWTLKKNAFPILLRADINRLTICPARRRTCYNNKLLPKAVEGKAETRCPPRKAFTVVRFSSDNTAAPAASTLISSADPAAMQG